MLIALRSRAFRLLWLAHSVSAVGDALVIVAIGLYVTRTFDDAAAVGWVLAAYAVPLVVFVLIGGVVADRLPRQQLMVASDVIRAGLHGTLAILIVTDSVQIWHFMVIGVLFGTAEAFFRPAYTGLVPQTVPAADIQAAQALGGLSSEIASFASPALATALVLGMGGAAAFALDAVTFVVSALLLVRVRPRAAAETESTEPTESVMHELREGWQAVRTRGWVIGTIAAFSAAILFAIAPFFVLGATVAKDVYDSDAVFGFTNAALGVGTVCGALLASRLRPRRPMFVGMVCGIGWPVMVTAFALGPPLAVLFVVVGLAGVGVGLFAVLWGDRVGPAGAEPSAVPRFGVGLHGVAGAAAVGLCDRRAAGGPVRGDRSRGCRWDDRHLRVGARTTSAVDSFVDPSGRRTAAVSAGRGRTARSVDPLANCRARSAASRSGSRPDGRWLPRPGRGRCRRDPRRTRPPPRPAST